MSSKDGYAYWDRRAALLSSLVFRSIRTAENTCGVTINRDIA